MDRKTQIIELRFTVRFFIVLLIGFKDIMVKYLSVNGSYEIVISKASCTFTFSWNGKKDFFFANFEACACQALVYLLNLFVADFDDSILRQSRVDLR